ncbi:hypothetical protein RISK_000846 [Rhodopirellula islandica]|uniref:Uncharacterized protein n=1 Tax=Rhodopirellula islandica TaxID=595434 RepID=A0A0J1BKI2_RHOIS|nr:hypothetical protein RISK_000846 [Rhodopirellula islandica]
MIKSTSRACSALRSQAEPGNENESALELFWLALLLPRTTGAKAQTAHMVMPIISADLLGLGWVWEPWRWEGGSSTQAIHPQVLPRAKCLAS